MKEVKFFRKLKQQYQDKLQFKRKNIMCFHSDKLNMKKLMIINDRKLCYYCNKFRHITGLPLFESKNLP